MDCDTMVSSSWYVAYDSPRARVEPWSPRARAINIYRKQVGFAESSLTCVNAATGSRQHVGWMTRNSIAGVLMLVCATTGQSIDTGVRYKDADLTRVKEAKLRLRCPHCHKYHVFSFADAKLRPIHRGEKVT